MNKKINKKRREFVKQSGIAAASFFIVPRYVLGKGYTAPSDRLNLAAIGAGGKGESDIRNAFYNGVNQVVALTDVDTARCKIHLKNFLLRPGSKIFERCLIPWVKTSMR